MVLEEQGYLARQDLETAARWSDGSSYLFVMDMSGNQLMTGTRLRVSGNPLYEFGRRDRSHDQFMGREVIRVGHTFGEAQLYYGAFNPDTGRNERKVALVKRVVSKGVPLLVGSGYYLDSAPASDATPCDENYVNASAVQAPEDVKAFVQCAAEFAASAGPEEARRAFNEDERWRAGPTYVFVDGVAGSGETSLAHVFPPDPSREGSAWGSAVDAFGTDYYAELKRILDLVDEGWIQYAFPNPSTGLVEPKSSYVIEMDWNGDRAAIGAGHYAPDFPGACSPAEVNAMDLDREPSDAKLKVFVNCAAQMAADSGLFAGPVLQRDPRWNHGSIYVFGLDVEHGTTLFASNPAAYEVSGRTEVLFQGRDMIAATALFGEAFWYYNFTDPASGTVRPKISFVKLVRASGRQILVGAGYNP